MVLQIKAKEIENLGKEIFVQIMNLLLRSEASHFFFPRTKLNLSLRIDDPDAGVDARVIDWPYDGGCIPKGLSVWQYKTGKVDNSDVKTECLKLGVLKALRNGGAYCFCMARDYVSKDIEDRRKTIIETLSAEGLKIKLEKKIIIFNGSTISDWASNHPIVIRFLGHPIGSLITHEEWSNNKLHQYPYRVDSIRDKITNEIRKQIESPHGPVVQRIIGRPGVGKTRLVLEALRPEGIFERVLYAPQTADIPPEFFGYISEC